MMSKRLFSLTRNIFKLDESESIISLFLSQDVQEYIFWHLNSLKDFHYIFLVLCLFGKLVVKIFFVQLHFWLWCLHCNTN